jgi:trehalose 6-phosphate phosphatase
MRHLFSNEGEAALADVMRRLPLLAFDYDGTLAPIVARPEDARVPMPVAQRLQKLAERVPVAIISGRAVADVASRLSFQPAHIIGSHGAEDPGDPARAAAMAAALDPLRARLAADHAFWSREGIQVEDKGASVALHYRLARNRDRAHVMILALLEDLSGPYKVFGGKMVVNVMPSDAADKGRALVGLVARLGAPSAVFVGDDVNDEPAFACAAPDWLTVRIGREDPASVARFFLDSTVDVPLMLDRMLAALDGAR